MPPIDALYVRLFLLLERICMHVFDLSHRAYVNEFEEHGYKTVIAGMGTSRTFIRDMKAALLRRNRDTPTSDVAIIFHSEPAFELRPDYIKQLHSADGILFRFKNSSGGLFHTIFGYFLNRKKYIMGYGSTGTYPSPEWLASMLWENSQISFAHNTRLLTDMVSEFIKSRNKFLNREVI